MRNSKCTCQGVRKFLTILQNIVEIKLIYRNCNASQFVTDDVSGKNTWSRCICVFSENSEDKGMKRRNFSGITDNTQACMTLKKHDKGLFTIIGAQNKDSVGKSLSAKTSQTFDRLRKWDSRSQAKRSADRDLLIALQEREKTQSKLTLSDTMIERGFLFYRKASEKGHICGRNVKSIVVTCLYELCRYLEHSRPLTKIAEKFAIHRRDCKVISYAA